MTNDIIRRPQGRRFGEPFGPLKTPPPPTKPADAQSVANAAYKIYERLTGKSNSEIRSHVHDTYGASVYDWWKVRRFGGKAAEYLAYVNRDAVIWACELAAKTRRIAWKDAVAMAGDAPDTTNSEDPRSDIAAWVETLDYIIASGELTPGAPAETYTEMRAKYRAEQAQKYAEQKEKAVAIENEKPKVDPLNAAIASVEGLQASIPAIEAAKAAINPDIDKLNAALAEAEAEFDDTPPEGTPFPGRYKVIDNDKARWFDDEMEADRFATQHNVFVHDTRTGEIADPTNERIIRPANMPPKADDGSGLNYADKSGLVENPERYKIVTAAGAYFENDLALALKIAKNLKGKVIDTQTGEHMSEAAAPAPKPAKPAKNDWMAGQDNREMFWAKAHENALKRGFSHEDVNPLMHAACNVVSMCDFEGSASAAMKLFIAELDKQRKANAPEPPPTTETVAETHEKAIVENRAIDGAKMGNPETALTTVPEKPKLAMVNERIQPNRFWLTSPAWQIGPFEMAKFITESGMFRNARTPAQALAIMFKGIELGVSPMAALGHINILGDGKPPSVDGALMLALLRKEGIRVKFVRRDEKACTVEMTRPDNGDSVQVTWTIEQAVKAGLTTRWNKEKGQYTEQPTWKNYPQAMLTWRAVSEAARLIASDIMIFGGIPMYINEEIAPDGVYDEVGALVA